MALEECPALVNMFTVLAISWGLILLQLYRIGQWRQEVEGLKSENKYLKGLIKSFSDSLRVVEND